MIFATRLKALALTAVLGFNIVVVPVAANASEEGKRNTTIALGAAAAGLLFTQKNKLPGAIAAAGAAYAYKEYDDEIKRRHRREREYGYDRRRDEDYRRKESYYESRYRKTSSSRNNDYDDDRRYNQRNNRDRSEVECRETRSYRSSSRR